MKEAKRNETRKKAKRRVELEQASRPFVSVELVDGS